MNPMQNAYTILGIIMTHAPTSDAQALMTRKYHEIQGRIYRDFERNFDVEAEKVMVGILNDGLKYGNWPWNTETDPKV